MSQARSQVFSSLKTLVPGLTDIMFVVVFLLALASGSQMLSLDSDLGRHLAIGKHILETRAVPTHDLFSHTLSNQSRPPYEWLSQVIFALANRLSGMDGVILLTAIIIATAFSLVFQFAVRRSGSPLLAFLITFLAAGASSMHWLPRPHIITFLLLAAWIENLEQLRRQKPVRLFTFLLLMLFWANLHGGFLYGILAWGAYFAGWLWEKRKKKANNKTGQKLVGAGLISLLASVITPDLWRNWEAVLNNRSAFILSRTVETMRPDLAAPTVLPFTIFLGLTVFLFLMQYRSLPVSHFILLVGLGFLSLLMLRNIPLFVIAATPIVTEMAKNSLTSVEVSSQVEKRFSGFSGPSWRGVLPLVIIALAVPLLTNQYFKTGQPIFQFNPQVFPVQAMDWLEAHPQKGRMFNEFNWGGYILYRAWPEHQVFLDSQSDFYGEDLMREYEQVISARGEWENLLANYQVDWAILPPDLPLTMALKSHGWRILHEDPTAVILARE